MVTRKARKAVKVKRVVRKKAAKTVSGSASKSHSVSQVGVSPRKTVSGLRSGLIKALSSEYAELASQLAKETGKRISSVIKQKMRAVMAEMKRLNAQSKK